MMTAKIVFNIQEIEDRPRVAITVGMFDGVHRGHQQLLQALVDEAKGIGAVPTVLTFSPHPRTILTAAKEPFYLQPLADRCASLSDCGVELIIVQPFNEAMRRTSAHDFVMQLDEHLDLRLWLGTDFGIGHERQGTFAFLQAEGVEKGFKVIQLLTLEDENGEVRSSRIREALQRGDVQEAMGCLGRPYAISGQVIQGRQLGRTIGVPTANLQPWPDQLLPQYGVYLTKVILEGESYYAVTNVGRRPTVSGESDGIQIETHIFDLDKDIYDKSITVQFLEYIRPEQKFSGIERLKEQIIHDIAVAHSRIAHIAH